MINSNTEPLTIKNYLIDPKLWESRPTQRCDIAECQAWCCTGGVWVDFGERDRILANAEKIKPFLPPDRQDATCWFDGQYDEDDDYPTGRGEGTSVVADPTHPVGNTCIFLRPENRYCAIQSASMAAGDHPWTLKPFYCILHPITIEDNLIQLDDENEIYIEGGHCQRPAFGPKRLYEVFAEELEFVLKREGLEELRKRVGN